MLMLISSWNVIGKNPANFNTSHVNVNQVVPVFVMSFTIISIHLMLMLIGKRMAATVMGEIFQYISC